MLYSKNVFVSRNVEKYYYVIWFHLFFDMSKDVPFYRIKIFHLYIKQNEAIHIAGTLLNWHFQRGIKWKSIKSASKNKSITVVQHAKVFPTLYFGNLIFDNSTIYYFFLKNDLGKQNLCMHMCKNLHLHNFNENVKFVTLI